MDPEKLKKNQEYAEEAFWTGHYHYMMQALAVAMSHTMVWRLVGDGTPFTLKDLFEFAREYDANHEIEAPSFYYVSREGAIALCPGLEYLAEWMFVPMEPCQERDFLMRDLQERLQEEAAVEEAVEKAITEGLAKEKEMKAQAAAQPKSPAIYYISRGGQRLGPFSLDDLRKKNVTLSTLIWSQGMSGWTKAGEIPQLAPLFAPAPVPPAPAPAPEVKYYISRGGQRLGPFSVNELLRNNLTSDTLVWTNGMSGWTKAADVPQLLAVIRK